MSLPNKIILYLLIYTSTTHAYIKDFDAEMFRKGMKQYMLGSYYTAMDYFTKLLLNKKSPYFSKSLLMMSKIYNKIGTRTGRKAYLWTAINYIQLYLVHTNKADWEYYYTKANIYEKLNFHETALTLYKIAYINAKNDKEKIKSIIGIMRTAATIRNKEDLFVYSTLINSKKQTKQYEHEIEFIKGLYLFHQNMYTQASQHLFRIYKNSESYLIENPEYYLLVGESFYRMAEYKIAKQIFKRIVSLTKNRHVIRKAMLRLGDLELREKRLKSALAYYYHLISEYPESQEATVARLKCIAMMKNPEIKYRLTLSEDPGIKKPISFIVKTMVSYRNSYPGIFALASFGEIALKSKSKHLLKKLAWELSVLRTANVKFEHAEFIRELWEPYIAHINPEHICKLYKANPNFFTKIFSKKTLIHISSRLKLCGEKKLRVALLNFIVNNWKKEKDKLLLAQALSESKDFAKSMKILKSIKSRNCKYYKILLDNFIMMGKNPETAIDNLLKTCKSNTREYNIFLMLKMVTNKNSTAAIRMFEKHKNFIVQEYTRNSTVKISVNKLLEELMLNDEYEKALKILLPLASKYESNCYIKSLTLISLSRIGMIKKAQKLANHIAMCQDSLSKTALLIYNTITISEGKHGIIQPH